MAEALRGYFLEYFSRFLRTGVHSFPSSFNVVESFLVFSHRYFAWDLRAEKEWLLKLSDYLDWYTAEDFAAEPAVLQDVMPEGVVHSYNMVSPAHDLALGTSDSELRIVGVSLVRHGPELSLVLLAGEAPSWPSDDVVSKEMESAFADPERRGIVSDPSLSVQDRYLAELRGHCRVLLLARFNLPIKRYDVRYVNIDLGRSYQVLSDDCDIRAFSGFGDMAEWRGDMEKQLRRYSELFSLALSSMYLPVCMIANAERVTETQFATDLKVNADDAARKSLKVLGSREVTFLRAVSCLTDAPIAETHSAEVTPPDLQFESSGFWRPLEPGVIGEDQDGNPVVGKTWVERVETWTVAQPSVFLMSRPPHHSGGPDPGQLYIMRSGTNYEDLYKIGLTRKDADVRAAKLSATTGVATPFEVLATWDTGHCASVEAEVHSRLSAYRVSKRREFFRAPLPMLIRTVNEIVSSPPACGS